MVTTLTLDDLRAAGLLDDATSPHLTDKGRDWLRALGDVETQQVVDSVDYCADLVLSTNGIFR